MCGFVADQPGAGGQNILCFVRLFLLFETELILDSALWSSNEICSYKFT